MKTHQGFIECFSKREEEEKKKRNITSQPNWEIDNKNMLSKQTSFETVTTATTTKKNNLNCITYTYIYTNTLLKHTFRQHLKKKSEQKKYHTQKYHTI